MNRYQYKGKGTKDVKKTKMLMQYYAAIAPRQAVSFLPSTLLILLFHLISVHALQAQQKSTPIKKPIAAFAHVKKILKGSPDFLASDGDEMWVLNLDRVEKLSVTESMPVLTANVPGACGAMAVGFNSLWVASCTSGSVYRIDNITGKTVAIIPCGVSDVDGEISLAIGDSALWILSDSVGTLTRIDVTTNKIEKRISVLPQSHCAVYGFNSVWITNTHSNSVQRIDPATNTVVATIPVGKKPRFLSAGEGGIWTLNQVNGTVSHIDPGTNTVVAEIETDVPGTGGDIAAGAGLIWVRATKKLLQTINPKSNKIEDFFVPAAGSGAVRVSDHNVWVTAHDINTIWVLKAH